MNISKMRGILNELSNERQIFHSEADFQHSLAWKFNKHKKNLGIKEVRLERRYFIGEKNDYIDIVLVTNNGEYIPIELKYKTKKTDLVKDKYGEEFELKNHGARDLGGYDFIKDLGRIESFIKKYSEKSHKGYAIFLTNDPNYLKSPKEETCYINFSIHQDRNFGGGTLCWNTKEKKHWQGDGITLNGGYKINWEHYSSITGQEFKFILLEIARKSSQSKK